VQRKQYESVPILCQGHLDIQRGSGYRLRPRSCLEYMTIDPEAFLP